MKAVLIRFVATAGLLAIAAPSHAQSPRPSDEPSLDRPCSFISAAQMASLLGTPVRSATDEQRLLATYCWQLLRPNHHVSDPVHARMLDRFGLSATIQVAALAGYVAMTSLIATAFELSATGESDKPLL